jgi:hypothetical protein
MKITKQTSKDEKWKDESGTAIPYNRITAFERSSEVTLYNLAVNANRINATLTEFKAKVKKEATRLYAQFLKENGGIIGKGKGGATFFNFDRSIKVEVSVNDQIVFDENTIGLAKNEMDLLMEEGLEGAKDFIKPILMDAFSTSNGKLDTKKVLGMKKWRSRVNHPRFDQMCEYIDKSIRIPSTKEYFRIWVRDEAGEYQNIQLNFASI